MGVTNPPLFMLGNQSNKYATNLPSTWPIGFTYYDIYGLSTYPNNYGTLMNFTSTHTNAVTQIYHTWDNQSGAGGTTALWARSNRDLNNQFGAFQPMQLGSQSDPKNVIQSGAYHWASQTFTGGQIYTQAITFPQAFKATPVVVPGLNSWLDSVSYCMVEATSITTTGFTLEIVFGNTYTRDPQVGWIAHGEG